MDQVLAFFESIDFEAIIATITEIIAKIEESGIIDKIVAFVSDLIAQVA